MKEKYMELVQSFRLLEEKSQKDKGEAKNYRNKFWQLKEIMK